MRIETRRCRVISDISKIVGSDKWPGLASVVEVYRKTTEKGKNKESTNYYISSSTQGALAMLKTIRSHWQVEVSHWMLDVIFDEDKSRIRKDNSPANIATVRRFVLNILNKMKGKNQTRPDLMKAISWSKDYLDKFINVLKLYS